MPNVPNRNCSTLNHLFAVPPTYHRDFLRENKEYVREKSKKQSDLKSTSSSDKVLTRVPPQNRKANMGYAQHNVANLRCVDSRYEKQNIPKARYVSVDRIRAAQRPINVKLLTTTTKTSTSVQTDDIQDEIYLYHALKKCASPAFKSALKAKYLQKDETHSKPTTSDLQKFGGKVEQIGDTRSQNVTKTVQTTQPITINSAEMRKSPLVERRNNNIDVQISHRPRSHHHQAPFEHEHFKNTAVTQMNAMTLSQEYKQPCSTATCLDCPAGLHLLSEEERALLKAKLQEREATLIKQLNSFPLATETLRVRQIKTKIERELAVLEDNLRKLTKRKVYAKLND